MGTVLSDRNPPPVYSDHSNLLVYRDANGAEHPITTPAGWEKRRNHILESMQLVMGPLPEATNRVALQMEVMSEEQTPLFTRRKITFAAEKNDCLPAYLLIPHHIKDKAPAMLCLHQTTRLGMKQPAGIDGEPQFHYAAHLAARGYVTLAPEYCLSIAFAERGQYGEYHVDPYAKGYVSNTMKGIWNHMRAVNLLQSLPYVDSERIGCIGHSLGGHNSMFAAAFDLRIKVIVASCGFTAFGKYFDGNLTGWSHKGYMPRIAERYDKDPRKMPFDFHEVVAAFAPRPFFVNAPIDDANFDVSGVKECIAAALPIYELFGAGENVRAIYPNCGHDFPDESREAAYTWIDRWLKA
jgi:dienelactone hydrolase